MIEILTCCTSSSSGPDADKILNRRAVQQRLLSILKAFAAVNGPQQLFKHKVLFSIFLSLLSHPDASVALLAFDCTLRFKPAYLVPYVEDLKKSYAKGKLRDALLQLRSADEDGVLATNHRPRLLPVLSRVLFGRLSARAIEGRSSKDSPSARRSAVLSSLSSICKDEHELYSFVYLMVRPYIPRKYVVKSLEAQDEDYRASLVVMLKKLSPDECSRLPAQVHQGFLNTLEAVVAQLGHKVEGFVPAFVSIILTLTKLYEVKKRSESVEKDGVGTAADDGRHESERSGSIRGLCYRRLADIFDVYSDNIEMDCFAADLWRAVKNSLEILPNMAVHSEKAPALLTLLKVLSSKSNLINLLSKCEEAVPCVLRCFAKGSRMSVVDTCLTFIDNLLLDGGDTNCGGYLLSRHIGLLLQQFRDRLNGAGESKSATWRRELAILCRVSEMIGKADTANLQQVEENAESLCSLLVPFLGFGRGCGDNDMTNVLGTLKALVPMVPPKSAITHYVKLSKLLGPFRTTAGITAKPIRAALAGVLEVLVDTSYNIAIPVVRVLQELCATSDKRVDEVDFDVVIPALSDLSDDSPNPTSWANLYKQDPTILLPLVHGCFHLLFNEDGVVTRGSFRALKALVELASVRSSDSSASEEERGRWVKLLEGSVIPLTRTGLANRDAAIRRYFILILRDVARHNKKALSSNLHGDLNQLFREDEPDLDFFISITHVQIHRRARALQRLRKLLVHADTGMACFGPQSLSHVLLPISLHPVYESTTKAEECLALEGIATVGSISRLLSWSKYNNLLWTALTQFHRHPEQEAYLVGLLCSIIDGFHFTVSLPSSEASSANGQSESAVWRALNTRFIPLINRLLVREKVNNKGEKVKMLRPSMVLAMLKLYKKLPSELFRSKLPRILTVICDALKSRESDSRDVARSTLASISIEIGVEYLADVVRELAITLTEGYKLHVRSAAIHSVLLKLATVYKPPQPVDPTTSLPFDKAVPALMDLIQQDLFGMAQERIDAEGSEVRYVKEAGGSRSLHSIELIASMILFRPSTRSESGGLALSSIHALVAPFVERLRAPRLQTRSMRQIKDCLSRIVNGLQRNPTVIRSEVLPYVYATVEPFVGMQDFRLVMEDMDDWSDVEDDPMEPLRVTGSNADHKKGNRVVSTTGSVVEWRPSALGASRTAKAAQRAKARDVLEIRKVKDGASAPKLTGSSRNSRPGRSTAAVNNPAAISAVTFGLRLLGTSLKKTSQDPVSEEMLDPFVPLLTTCVCRCRDSEVVLLSLKCLGWLMRSELPSLSRCARSLAGKALELLTSSGASSNQNQELTQASFKMLTFLINYDRKHISTTTSQAMTEEGESAVSQGVALPLDAEQMQVLLSFLQGSLGSSDHQNPAIGLVKAIMSRQFASAELYDLMDTILELSVRSSKPSLREQSCAIVVSFLINYPLSEARLEQHLQQMLLNLKYEYSDGRLSALSLVASVVAKFPSPLIEQHCQMLFLPLAMQLVNDDSKECREKVADCIAQLLQRLPTKSLQTLYDYTDRWSDGTRDVQRMALQLFRSFMESNVDFLKRGDTASRLLLRLKNVLEDRKDDWEVVYFALLSLERMSEVFPEMVARQTDIWKVVLRTMTNRHAWVKKACVRLLSKHLSSLDPTLFRRDGSTTFLAECEGALYQVARNFCFQLAAEEEEQVDDLVPLIVKSLTWTIQAMSAFPQLCFDDESGKHFETVTDADDGDSGSEQDDGSVETEQQSKKTKDPVFWVMMRLSNMAKPRGTKRRQAVFKCFAAFATFASDVVMKHMDLMLGPLHRSASEQESRQVHPLYATAAAREKAAELSDEGQLVQEVLYLLEEESPDSSLFMDSYAAVKKRALDKKQQRKLAVKTEYVLDPQKSAQRRIRKQEREKQRRKRRVDGRRQLRGGVAKRRHVDPS